MGKFLKFVKSEDGWEYVTRVGCPGAVIVLVYHKITGRFLVVEQYRPPVKRRVTELTAGLIDSGETPGQAAVRELSEETGVAVGEEELINLGFLYSSVGLTDEKVYAFAVEIDDTKIAGRPELHGAEEKFGLISKWISEKDLYRLNAAKALSVFARYRALKENPDLVFEY